MSTSQLKAEIKQRFGDVPSFFLLAMQTPEVADDLWKHTVAAYLDNPIPFAFKERLFLYLSRFCRVRYCLSRHSAILLSPRSIGLDAGDGMSAERILKLLRTPSPTRQDVQRHLAVLLGVDRPFECWPDSDSVSNEALFACCVAIFLQTEDANECRDAIRHSLSPNWYQRLLMFMAFVRRAHDWTEAHPDLSVEPDIQRLIDEHRELAKWIEMYRENVDTQDPPVRLDQQTEFDHLLLSKLAYAIEQGLSLDQKDGRPDKFAPEIRGDVELLMRVQNLAMQATNIGFLITDATAPDMPIVYCNTGFQEMTGYRAEEVLGKNCRFLQVDDRDQEAVTMMRDAVADRRACKVVLRNYRKDGTLFWNEVSISPVYDSERRLTHFVGIQNDVTERQQRLAEQRRWYRVLDSMSDGTSLRDLLRLIVGQAESARTGMLASIMLLEVEEESQRLHVECAPSLPESVRSAIDGLVIGPNAGACGTAAYEQRRVIVTDTLADDLWRDYRELARESGLRACWSEPIFSSSREILGTLAMYFREPQSPSAADLQLLEHSAQLAGIVIDRSKAGEQLANSEERLRLALKATNDAIWDLDVPTDRLWWNDVFEEHFGGLQPTESALEWWKERLHPDDRSRLLSLHAKLVSGEGDADSRWSTEYRLRRQDGTYAVVEDRAFRSYDENGKLVRVIGALNDLTQRRALEREVLDIAAEENWRIGTDLHDGVGQELTGMGMMADALVTSLSREKGDGRNAAHAKIAGKLADSIGRTLGQVRALARGMNPVDIDREGLMSALSDMCDRILELHGVHCRFECDQPMLFRDTQTATQLYRIAQEATTNAIRHGKATRITIALGRDGESALRVVDNGIGIAGDEPPTRGLGLRTMGYRAGLIGGQITIEKHASGGTEVACVFPHDAIM